MSHEPAAPALWERDAMGSLLLSKGAFSSASSAGAERLGEEST